MDANTMRDFNPNNYGDGKCDKSTELSEDMSIQPTKPDEYENAIYSLSN